MSKRRLQIGSKDRGFALIAVMWVVLVAGLMFLGVQKAVRANLAGARSELASVQAHWLARAGIEQALAVLEDDVTDADNMLEYWYSDTEYFENVEMLHGSFSVRAGPNIMDDPREVRYGLTDLCARVNVNTADAGQLRALLELEAWQIDSILDWRDDNDRARANGVEAQYYDGLEYRYLIRNGPLHSIEELRLIRGIEEQYFSGEDANLNGVLDVNEDDGEAAQYALYPDDNGDGQLTLGLGGLTSVYGYTLNQTASGDSRVNVNTADRDTLVERFNFTNGLAQAIVDHRASGGNSNRPEGERPSGRTRFNSLMELTGVRAGRNSDSQDEGEGTVKEITLKWLADNLDDLTLSDEERLPGLINVNTACKEVLMSLPRITPSSVEAIVRRQASGQGPLNSVGELFTDKTISEEQFKAFAERLTVRSSVFEIRSTGQTTWGISREIVAVVDRGSSPVNILYWYQSE